MKNHERTTRFDSVKIYVIKAYVYFNKIDGQTEIGRCLGPKPVYRCDLCRLNSEIRHFFTNGFLGVLNGNLIVVVKTNRGQNKLCIAGDNVQWTKRTQSRHLRLFLGCRYRPKVAFRNYSLSFT